MDKTLKYAVVGTGAIGGYYGGKLADNGKEVHFLLNSDYKIVKENGLRIDSTSGNFIINPINAYNNSKEMPKVDVVLVCLKTTKNKILKEILPPLLHEETIVILIQNGIGLEADVQEMFPTLSLVAGLAFICSSKFSPGHITHQHYGRLTLGDYSCKNRDILKQVTNDFISSGVETIISDYAEARWKKAVWNMPFNGLTVALNSRTEELLSFQLTAELIKEMMLEVIGAAIHLGVKNISYEFADKMIQSTMTMPSYAPSMKLDYENTRPMELYYIYERPIIEAEKVEFEMPKLSMLHAELKYIENKHK